MPYTIVIHGATYTAPSQAAWDRAGRLFAELDEETTGRLRARIIEDVANVTSNYDLIQALAWRPEVLPPLVRQRPGQQAHRVVAYVRVSTDDQAANGLSLEAQATAARQYAALRQLGEPEVVRDTVSAKVPLSDREQGRKLHEDVLRGNVAHVIATRLDRLFRSVTDGLLTLDEWGRSVALHLSSEDGVALDTSTAVGRMVLTMRLGYGEFERRIIGERTKLALAQVRSSGRKMGRPGYGEALVDGRRVPVPAEQAVLVRIRELRQAKHTPRQIAEILTAEGVPTKTGLPAWTKYAVDAVLRAPWRPRGRA